MIDVKVPFPQISSFMKTRLQSQDPTAMNISAGATEIFIRNPTAFNIGDYIVIDAFESMDAEIVQIIDIDVTGPMLIIDPPTQQNHDVGCIVMQTPFNMVNIYRGLLPDMSDHVKLASTPLYPCEAYTVYHDLQGTSLNYYSYIYEKYIGPPVGVPLSDPNVYSSQILYTPTNYDSVLTVNDLLNHFMFGLDLTDDNGYPFPNSMFEFAIRAAVDSLEKTLMIHIKPMPVIGERQDYYRQDYMDFAFIQLNNYPIFDVTRVALRYPTAGSDITFPTEWYQINKEHGQVHLIPTSGSLSQILMGQGGDYLTFVWKGWDWMPNLWVIDYMAGFAPVGYKYVAPQAQTYMGPLSYGIPSDIIGVVGKMACFYPLNISGDLVGGIAIASKSIGIDGLSQSINTTSSPENAGYSARLRQYERELKVEIPRLKAFYKGLMLSVA